MFIVNDDNSIYATRGDIVYFTVTAQNDAGLNYEFQPGDLLRMKIFGKKDAESVYMQKEFPVTEATNAVEIYLDAEDTKIGETISKPRDYWYEIELNPHTDPQTIVGYGEDGPAVFRLFPEGEDIPEPETKPEDIPVVDTELDMTSPRPVQNRAIARAIVSIEGNIRKMEAQANKDRDNTAALEAEITTERARLDNLTARKDVSVSKALDYLDGITAESKIEGHIESDGVFANIKVNFREANLIYGGTERDMFIIPDECRPRETGLIHTEDGLEYSIKYDAANIRYYLSIAAQDSVTVAPSGAGSVTMSYALDDHELKDIRVGADGTVYESAGAAVREQVKILTERVREMTYCNDKLRLNGYYEPVLTFENKYFKSENGKLYDLNTRAITNFIYCPYGAVVDIKLNDGYSVSNTANYDASGNYLGYGRHFAGMVFQRYVIYKSDDTTITPSEAAANVTVTVRTSRTITEDRAKTIAKNYAEAMVGKNLFDRSKAEFGYINDTYGRLVAPNNAYYTSDFIPVDAGVSVTISPRLRKFLAYDENFMPIADSFIDAETANYIYTAEQKGYIRFTYYESDDNVQAEYGNIVTDYAAYRVTLKSNVKINTALHNKVGLSFGDSIMYGSGNGGVGILDILGELFGVVAHDYSVGGASVQKISGRNFVGDQVAKAVAAGVTPDFILLDGLSNDIVHGTLGEMSGNFNYDTNGNASFANGLEYCIGLIKDAFPLVPLLYIIPHSSAGRDYAVELKFGNMAREICEKWSVPVADIYKDGNMTARLKKQLQAFTHYPAETSGTHPNRNGYDHAYIPIVASKLNTILKHE